jgi:hypothetical protein
MIGTSEIVFGTDWRTSNTFMDNKIAYRRDIYSKDHILVSRREPPVGPTVAVPRKKK